MKSGSSITLTKAWWKKEAPDGLKKSAAGFEKALDDVAKAEGGLSKGGEAAVKTYEKALDALAAAGKAVAAEARDLEKKTKDKKAKTDLANTVSVMGKPLSKAVSDARSAAADAASADDDDTSGIKDPDAFVAYMLQHVSKLKKRQFSFALGMPSNVPEDMRLRFHATKGGKGLMSKLKQDIGAKKVTWGKCGAETVFAKLDDGEDPDDDSNPKARTLVLDVMGKQIPSLRRRVRMMLKKLGISQFNNVKILVNGREVDADDDSDDDAVALDDIDLDTPDADDDGDDADAGQAPAGGGGAPAGGRPTRKPALDALEKELDGLIAELA